MLWLGLPGTMMCCKCHHCETHHCKTAAGGSEHTFHERPHTQRYRQTYELLFGKICTIVRHLCIQCKRAQDEKEREVDGSSTHAPKRNQNKRKQEEQVLIDAQMASRSHQMSRSHFFSLECLRLLECGILGSE